MDLEDCSIRDCYIARKVDSHQVGACHHDIKVRPRFPLLFFAVNVNVLSRCRHMQHVRKDVQGFRVQVRCQLLLCKIFLNDSISANCTITPTTLRNFHGTGVIAIVQGEYFAILMQPHCNEKRQDIYPDTFCLLEVEISKCRQVRYPSGHCFRGLCMK